MFVGIRRCRRPPRFNNQCPLAGSLCPWIAAKTKPVRPHQCRSRHARTLPPSCRQREEGETGESSARHVHDRHCRICLRQMFVPLVETALQQVRLKTTEVAEAPSAHITAMIEAILRPPATAGTTVTAGVGAHEQEVQVPARPSLRRSTGKMGPCRLWMRYVETLFAVVGVNACVWAVSFCFSNSRSCHCD